MFSFGIVMWELLTGEEPYADLHYGAIIGNFHLLKTYSITFLRLEIGGGLISCQHILQEVLSATP